nr:MAG: coat protein [Chemarfal virus 53]
MTLVVDNSPSAAPRSSYRRRAYRRRRPMYRRRSYRRRTTRRRSARRSRKMSLMDLEKLPKFIKAQIDPFKDDVDGVKIPDSNTYPSTALKIEDQFTGQGTDANGLRAQAFTPFLINTAINAVGATSSSWTWPAAFGGGVNSRTSTAVFNSYGLCRPVAHGLRITCNYAPQTIQGNIHIAVYATSDFNKTTWNFPVNISEMTNAMFYKKYPLAQFTQQGLTVVNKFLDCTSTKYVDPSSDGVATSTDVGFQTNGWAVILVVVEGGPASAASVYSVDSVIRMEAIPNATGVDNASPAAPFNVGIQQTVSRMAGQIPATFADQEEQSYLTQVAGQLSQGLSLAGNTIFNDYVLPTARRAGYAAGAAAFGYARNRFYGIPGITQFRNGSPFATLT